MLLLILQSLFTFFTKQATLMRRSTVLMNLPLLAGEKLQFHQIPFFPFPAMLQVCIATLVFHGLGFSAVLVLATP